MLGLFSEAAEVTAVVVGPQGQPITDFANDCALCNLILASGAGRRRCVRSRAALADGLDGASRLRRCHAGLLYARTTIHIEGKPLAAVIAGQPVSDSDRAEGQPERLSELAEACASPLSCLQEA